MTAFSEKVRETVRERAAGKCELCGLRVVVAHFHHRRPRGMGGTKRQESGLPSNCLVVHPSCHSIAESNRQRSLDNGWLVRQYEDPLRIPVKLWSGWALLRDDGSTLHKRADIDMLSDPLGYEWVGNSDARGPGGDEPLDPALAEPEFVSDLRGGNTGLEKVEAQPL